MRGLRELTIACALASACNPDPGTTESSSTAAASTTTTPDPTGGEMVPLVGAMEWMQVAAAADPLPDHRPAEVICPLGAWVFEAQGLEIDTTGCNYGSFTQPAKVDVGEGKRIVASLYHFDLTAAEPATAHAALLIGETIVWEQEIAIPGPANAFMIDLPSPVAAPAGTPVYFHLHNHGQNTWTLGNISVAVD